MTRSAAVAKKPGLGAGVRKLRSERVWSQEKLAELARISVRTIQRLESEDECSPHTVRAVADALEADIQQLTSTGEAFDRRPPVEFIPRIVSGQQLCNIVGQAGAISHDNDEPQDENELEFISSFIQELCDTCDIWSDMEPKHQIEAGYRLTKQLRDLEQLGFSVFAESRRRRFFTGRGTPGAAVPWDISVAIVIVLRSDNPAIVRLSPTLEAVATARGDEQHASVPTRADAPEHGLAT
jgi:transcriptional regulator with XRE-family HTH domain